MFSLYKYDINMILIWNIFLEIFYLELKIYFIDIDQIRPLQHPLNIYVIIQLTLNIHRKFDSQYILSMYLIFRNSKRIITECNM